MGFTQKYLYFRLYHANSNLCLLVSGASFLQLWLSFVLYKQRTTIWPTTSHAEDWAHSPPRHRIKTRAFWILPDWKSEGMPRPWNAFQKCASGDKAENVKRIAEMCAGEYLSRNKHGGIVPCAIACNMSNPIQYFLAYLEKDRALKKGISGTQEHGEETVKRLFIRESRSLIFF